MKRQLIAILSLLINFHPYHLSGQSPDDLTLIAVAGGREGSGGDPVLDMYFEFAKTSLMEKLSRFEIDLLPENIDPRVRRFITLNLSELKKDVAVSEYVWETRIAEGQDSEMRAAWTKHTARPGPNPKFVVFSQAARKKILGVAEAEEIRLHESCHHFGLGPQPEDEVFITSVVAVLLNQTGNPVEVDPIALQICQESRLSKFTTYCAKAIAGKKFERLALRTCDEMDHPSTVVRCLQVISDAIYRPDILRACDEKRSNYDTLDCLKAFSGKSAATLEGGVFSKESKDDVWVSNYSHPELAWGDIEKQAQNRCTNWRYFFFSDPNWKESECWDCRLKYTGYYPPQRVPLRCTYWVKPGKGDFTNCVPRYYCATK